jgi:hypothetical protein
LEPSNKTGGSSLRLTGKTGAKLAGQLLSQFFDKLGTVISPLFSSPLTKDSFNFY